MEHPEVVLLNHHFNDLMPDNSPQEETDWSVKGEDDWFFDDPSDWWWDYGID